MQKNKPTVALYHDIRRAIKSGENAGKYPVKVRVTFEVLKGGTVAWIQKYYPTGVYLSKADFVKATSDKPGRILREVSDKLVSLKVKALQIINDSPVINPELFELYYTGKAIRSTNVENLFNIHITRFYETGKIKSRDSYISAKNSILDFVEGEECPKCHSWYNPLRMENECPHKVKEKPEPSGLLLNNIDKDLLERYERWMIKSGHSVTTVGIYLRNLRAVFNHAIDDLKILSRDLYPFGRKRYQIPESNNLKKALTDAQKLKLFTYTPHNDREAEALDFWKLFYYCDGINPIDIAYLEDSNLSEDSFKYFRKKTETTKRVQVEKGIHIGDEVRDIFNRRATHRPYLFGVLKPDMTAEQKRRAVENWVRRINEGMELITKKLGLPKVTTYTARHTVATTYMRNGVDIAKIKDIFTHSSIATTEKYVKGIEGMEEQKELSKLLLIKPQK